MVVLRVLFVFCFILACQQKSQGPEGHDANTDSAPPSPPPPNQNKIPSPPVEIPLEQAEVPGDEIVVPDLGIPYTHEEMEHYRQIKEQIWKSSLGQVFQRFVRGKSSDVARLSSEITERIFSVRGEELVRVAALQVMVEDLYSRGRFTPEVSYRLMVLEGNVNQRQFVRNSVPVERLLYQSPVFLLIGFLTGSPAVKEETQKVYAKLLRAILRRREEATEGELKLARLFSPVFFKNYNVPRMVNSFVNSFGSYSFLFIYVFREREIVNQRMGNGRFLIMGLERLLQLGEL